MSEFAWVIEHVDSPSDRPLYWIGGGERGGANEWSSNNLDAVRFAREQDAAVAAARIFNHATRVREHGWIVL